jgi:alpha-beta hydrolase superfamily lysophospholipase
MKHPLPRPPEIGALDGLSYALFVPDEPAAAGIVICHGAGSAKESHFEFARYARDSGLAALAFDMRGHGRSEGNMGPGTLDDVLRLCDLLSQHAPAVAIRGSSMGGFCAISAAAQDRERVCAVVAICPAPEDFLLRGLRSGDLADFRVDRTAAEHWLETTSLKESAASLSPTPLLLLHAQADERIPYTTSEELYEAAGDPKRLVIVPGGNHRSVQHDLELHALTISFVRKAAAAAGGAP